MEFNNNTGSCFISDKVLADNFGVSEKTISRTIKALEDKGFITRNTVNVKGGKQRHMLVNQKKIEEVLTKDNLSVDDNNNGQNDCCTMDNLSVVNGQNDLIKDNIKDNSLKDNNGEALTASAVKTSLTYPVITVAQLTRDNIAYDLIQDSTNLIRIKATGAICKVV